MSYPPQCATLSGCFAAHSPGKATSETKKAETGSLLAPVRKARRRHLESMAVPVEEFFAGSSSTALKRVHRQRLMAFGVVLVGCTLVSWILVILCWQLTPSTRGPGSRILADFLSMMVRNYVRFALFGELSLSVNFECVWDTRRKTAVFLKMCEHSCSEGTTASLGVRRCVG